MNCELIFYLAKKTSMCERVLKKQLTSFNINLGKTFFSTGSIQLGTLLCDTFKHCNLCFIVGGLEFSDRQGIKNVLSKALAYETLDDMKKIENPNNYQDGYVFRAGSQLLIVLPDEPDDISAMLKSPLKEYLMDFAENSKI
ncbi:MAG: hypothetical protein PUD24_00885 [Oscillospiraceae bacterium]|nr:hypothetical protein [Oscillospiraceae bacterium]